MFGEQNKTSEIDIDFEFILFCILQGKFYLMSKGGKVEKAIDAHKGAVIACRWSYDGTMIASGML
jgi:hypothetical protein